MSWNYDPSKYPSPTQPQPQSDTSPNSNPTPTSAPPPHQQQQQRQSTYPYPTSSTGHGSPTVGGGRNGYGDDSYTAGGGGQGGGQGYYGSDHPFPTTPAMSGTSGSPRPGAAGIPPSGSAINTTTNTNANATANAQEMNVKSLVEGRYLTDSPQGQGGAGLGAGAGSERGSGRSGAGGGYEGVASGGQASNPTGAGAGAGADSGNDRYSSYGQQYQQYAHQAQQQQQQQAHAQASAGAPYGYAGYDYAHAQHGHGGQQPWSSGGHGGSGHPYGGGGGGQQHYPSHHLQQRTISGSSAGGLPPSSTTYTGSAHPVPATAPPHNRSQNPNPSPTTTATPTSYGYDPRQFGATVSGGGGGGAGYGYSQMTGTVQPGHYSGYANPAYLAQQANASGHQHGHQHGGGGATTTQSAPASNAGINPSWPGQGYESMTPGGYYGAGAGGPYSGGGGAGGGANQRQAYPGSGGGSHAQPSSAHPHSHPHSHQSGGYPSVNPMSAQGYHPHSHSHAHAQQTMHPSVMAQGMMSGGDPRSGAAAAAAGGNKKRQAEEELVVEKGGKKSKKGKKEEIKDDPNAAPAKSNLHPPRQSSSAWQIFFTDHLAEVKASSGAEKINVANIAKEAGLIYSKMDAEAKRPFMERADEARTQYQLEYAAWLDALTPEEIKHENLYRAGQRKIGKSRKGNLKDLHAPKKPLSAYFLFLKAIRSDDKLSAIVFGKETETTKQSMNAAGRWRSFTDADKRPFLNQAEADKAEYDTMRKLYEEESAQRARGEDVPIRDYQPSYVRDPPGQILLDAVLAPGDGAGIRLTAEQIAELANAPEVDLADMTHDSEEHHSSAGDEENVSPSALLKSPEDIAAETPASHVDHSDQIQRLPSYGEPAPEQSAPLIESDVNVSMDQLLDIPLENDLQPHHDDVPVPDFAIPAFNGGSSLDDASLHHIDESAYIMADDDHLEHGTTTKLEQYGGVKEEGLLLDDGLDDLVDHQAIANDYMNDMEDVKAEDAPEDDTDVVEEPKVEEAEDKLEDAEVKVEEVKAEDLALLESSPLAELETEPLPDTSTDPLAELESIKPLEASPQAKFDDDGADLTDVKAEPEAAAAEDGSEKDVTPTLPEAAQPEADSAVVPIVASDVAESQ